MFVDVEADEEKCSYNTYFVIYTMIVIVSLMFVS